MIILTLEERIDVLRNLKRKYVVYSNIYIKKAEEKLYRQFILALDGAIEDCKAKLRREGERDG